MKPRTLIEWVLLLLALIVVIRGGPSTDAAIFITGLCIVMSMPKQESARTGTGDNHEG